MSDSPEPDGESEVDDPLDGDDGSTTDDGSDAGAESATIGLVEARQRAVSHAETILEHPIDDVIKVNSQGDGWQVVVEVLERSGVPDTQDMLARYELLVDGTGELTEYSILERYRRGDLRGDL
jgi:hypothetical protein